MSRDDAEFRRLVAQDYDLIGATCAALPTARLYDEAILRSLPEDCGLVVDAGCGSGELTARLAACAARVLGLDISEAAVRRAQETALRPNIVYSVGALEDLPSIVGRRTCSAIVANRVLHHCTGLSALLPRLIDLLEPGGRLVILDLDSTGHGCSALRRRILVALYCLTVMAKGWAHGALVRALRDLRTERRAYRSVGWRLHLSHEPLFEWRNIEAALTATRIRFTSRRINWRFHLLVAYGVAT